MPATGRRELDEGYKPLAFEELAAVYRTLRNLESCTATGSPVVFHRALLEDMDRIRSALTRIKFITPEEQS